MFIDNTNQSVWVWEFRKSNSKKIKMWQFIFRNQNHERCKFIQRNWHWQFFLWKFWLSVPTKETLHKETKEVIKSVITFSFKLLKINWINILHREISRNKRKDMLNYFWRYFFQFYSPQIMKYLDFYKHGKNLNTVFEEKGNSFYHQHFLNYWFIQRS